LSEPLALRLPLVSGGVDREQQHISNSKPHFKFNNTTNDTFFFEAGIALERKRMMPLDSSP